MREKLEGDGDVTFPTTATIAALRSASATDAAGATILLSGATIDEDLSAVPDALVLHLVASNAVSYPVGGNLLNPPLVAEWDR